ncbi:tigger transposable element-derived protein 4-like [Rhizophagus irregularis DAOM 181602=DAOM 197198]|nr:tigger transposable element-derived protein 4-like [Rhizophagus irregularis DAOM 181602=DAOM 197198]
MSTKRKRVNLSAGQKREICEMKERDLCIQNVELAQKYNVGKSTITDILKESERWLTITESQGKVKKFRGPKWPQLEDALGLWVDNALNTKQDIDGNILKIKASYFAEQFSIEDFHHSEERDRLALQQFLTTYNPEDIWNGDETGLFWKMEPSRVLARNSLSGHKKEKSRVTIFCATNVTGSEKMTLTFIHKYKTPRVMKNINHKNLSVHYFWNKKAWMQVSIFNDILLKLNEIMRRKNRKIVFLVDNAPVHIILDETQEKLDSIDVKFLPPNTTTKLQPCDAGIIHSFKCHYNRLFLQNQINAYDDVQDGIVEELADYTIYDALQNAAEAWSMVTSQTISNCWKKTGILPQSDEFEEFSDDNDSVLSDSFDIEINELEVLISQFPKSDFNAYEYLHIEDEILEGGLTDHEIVDTIRNANREEENVVDEIELTHIMEKISPTEVEKAIDKTIRFLYEQGPEFGEVNEELKILRRLHKKVKVLIVKNLKQIDLHYFRYDNVI